VISEMTSRLFFVSFVTFCEYLFSVLSLRLCGFA
jgi:hypothetical protein